MTIHGGGLAGLSLGVALAGRGVEVAIHEAAEYPRHRVCGEFLSGVSEDTLARLGVTDALGGAVSISDSAWFLGSRRLVRHRLPEVARGISRWTLDQALARLFQANGGRLETRSRVSSGGAGEGVVVATGRRSGVGRWIGVSAHFSGLVLESDLEMHLGRGGYLGLAKVDGGFVNAAGLFRDLHPRRADGLVLSCLREAGLDVLAERLSRVELREGSEVAVAGFAIGRQPSVPGLVLGDRARMIPPFAGNGMSMAFESAAVAVEPLVGWAAGRWAWSRAVGEIQRALAGRFRRRMVAARVLHALLLHPAGRLSFAWLGRAVPYEALFRALRT
jgi:flavin-dependent dehydrogenase